MKSGFVYKWANTVNGKWYIGSHEGEPDDGYVGSGIAFLRAYHKYGPENFSRIILYSGPEFRGWEEYFLIMSGAADRKDSYNLIECSYEKTYLGTSARAERYIPVTLAREIYDSYMGSYISQQRLSIEYEISQSTVSNIINGRGRFSVLNPEYPQEGGEEVEEAWFVVPPRYPQPNK